VLILIKIVECTLILECSMLSGYILYANSHTAFLIFVVSDGFDFERIFCTEKK